MRSLRRLIPVLFVGLTATITTAQRANFDANGEPTSLPYHDVRLVDGETVPAVRAAVAGSRTIAQRAARQSAFERLSRDVPRLKMDDDELFGTPHFLRSTARFLTDAPDAPYTPKQVVRDFVREYRDLFEIDAAELDGARMARDFETRHNGITHLTYQQQYQGVDIWGAEMKANVSRHGELINISSTLLPRPAKDFAVPAASLGPLTALRRAASSVGIDMRSSPDAVGRPHGANQRQTWTTTPDFRSGPAITSELIYFALTRTEIHPAWLVVVPEIGVGNEYEIMVDATDGTILRRWNRLHYLASTENITFNVFTGDSPAPGSPGTSTPTGFQFPTVSRTTVVVTPGDVTAFSPDGWIDDGVNETLGNNCSAHLDLDGNDVADLPRPTGSPYRVFDFPLDLAQSPTTYRDASVAQLFYYSNVYHDKLYELGWDEPASNLQDDNFGLGGVGGDRLQSDAQDGLAVNNAQFVGSGSDGSTARIRMYIFDGPNPDRDGSFDGDVVYHEITHGLSIRLSGGTVFGEQSGGMGEGWGDYFGMVLNAEAGDDPHAVYTTGGYITFQFFGLLDNYYFGIRRFPYSTDLTKSPATYADIDPGQISFPGGIPQSPIIPNTADEVHNVGEIWCQTLMECRANLWDLQGFSANDLMMQLVVDGLKLMPSNPNMLQARDAILAADLADNGGANLGELWAGFAKRGMGASATSPSGSTTTGIVEAFDVPPLILFDYPGGQPDQLSPMQANTFDVNVSGLGSSTPTPNTGTLSYSVNGGSFTTIPMVQGAANEYEATLPGFDCFDEVEFYVSVDSNQGMITDPPDAPTTTFTAEVFTGITTVFADDFEANNGWTIGGPGDDATTGVWERVDPVGTAAQPEDDNSDPGTICFVTGQGLVGGGLGDNDVDGGQTTLTSPTIDLSGGDARIGYYRWYSNDTGGAPNADVFVIDVSNNGGGAWTNVETIGPAGAGTSGGWIYHEFLVSDFVAPTANVQVRFIASDEGTGSLVEAGVDDFDVFRVDCAAACQTDLGFGGPGPMTMSLCGDGFGTGETNDLLVTGAPPFAVVSIIFGLSSNPTPFKGGMLVPVPILASIGVNADGAGEIFAPLPGGGGPATFYMQAATPDAGQIFGWSISNAIEVFLEP